MLSSSLTWIGTPVSLISLKLNILNMMNGLKKNGFWTGTAEHAVQTTTFKVLTDASKNFIFHSNLHSTKEQAE